MGRKGHHTKWSYFFQPDSPSGDGLLLFVIGAALQLAVDDSLVRCRLGSPVEEDLLESVEPFTRSADSMIHLEVGHFLFIDFAGQCTFTLDFARVLLCPRSRRPTDSGYG